MKYHLLFIFIILFFKTFSQSYEDSLKSALKNSTDTNRINILNQLSYFYCERNDSISNSYANEAISLSEKFHFKKGKGNAFNNKGIVFDVIGNYDSALFYYYSSLKIAEEIKNNGLKANVYNNIGLIFWNKGEFEKALKVYFISLNIYEKSNDRKGIAKVTSNIGLIYNDSKNYTKALLYHFKSLHLREELNDENGIGISLTNIGNTYDDIDSSELALKYFNKSIQYKKRTNDLYGLAIVYNNIGGLLSSKEKLEDALRYFLMALPIRIELNDDFGLVTTYNNLAEVYRKKGEISTSLTYCLKSLELAEKLKSKTKLKKVYYFLHANYKDIGDYKNALIYFEKYDRIKDSIYTLEGSRSMNEMQTKYETEKKEQQLKLKSVEIERQKYQNKIQVLLFCGLAFLIIFIFGFVFYRNNQLQKAKLIKENSRQEKLRFKAIIDSEEKERIRVAKELHDGLGQLLSSAKLNISSLEDNIIKEDEYLLKNSLNIIDDAVKEVRNISHNMMPTALMNYGLVEAINGIVNKLNDSKQINVIFNKDNFDALLEKETEITIYRVIQEIINNMLKHSKAKIIEIILFNNINEIQLKVMDNGIGFNTAEIENSKGIGWENIYSRVSMLNGKIFVSSQIGKGTEVFVTINV
jgi:signal transduction histidine kinase/Tfp pilus assembly protein PilF